MIRLEPARAVASGSDGRRPSPDRALFPALFGAFAFAAIALAGSPAGAVCLPATPAVVYYPADGTTDAPTDVVVRAQTPPGAAQRPLYIALQRSTGGSVAGTTNTDLTEVTFTPNQPLDPFTGYDVLYDFGTGAAPMTSFTTGGGLATVPTFAGITSLDWHYYPTGAPCAATRAPAFQFSVGFDAAAGIDPQNAEYWILLRRDPTVAPAIVAVLRGSDRVTAPDGTLLPVEFALPESASGGATCFLLRVVNLADEPDGNTAVRCTVTDRGPHFQGMCGIAGAGFAGAAALLPWALAAVAIVLLRRRSNAR